MKTAFILIIVAFPLISACQGIDSLRLDYCISRVIENYPQIKQKNLLASSSDIKTNNLQKNYLPQISVNGQASYQSEVTTIPISFPGIKIPVPDKDSYKATVDLNQMICDGGYTQSQVKAERISGQADVQNTETELYQLKDRVNQIFFNILVLQENERQIQSIRDNISSKLNRTISGITNGVLSESNREIMEAELLSTEEQLEEIQFNIRSNNDMLGTLMNTGLSGEIPLALPSVSAPVKTENNRPEMKLFEYQSQKTDIMKDIVNSRNMPKLSCFGELGYGKPGLNMLSDKFDKYYMLGAKLSWSPWDWHQSNNEKAILDIQKNIILTQKETFEKNLAVSAVVQRNELEKYDRLMKKDQTIIEHRKKVVDEYSSQLDNGVITSSDYINELNNLKQAELNFAIHRIMKVRTMINLMNINGNQ